ncbi:IclR family transcriptional regulator [Streptomyces sp. NPDC001985]|uniref:IclR family transcriptional regulator n=1 Tax=Streptomyces sp. NPDC001985 TaxID=3154406 RepID=UPI0033297BC7
MTTSASPGTLQYVSGVGVLDKTSLVLSTIECGPASLNRIVASTGLPRSTAHRLTQALERIRLIGRDAQGRFVLGPRLGEMAAEAQRDRMLAVARPLLAELRDRTRADVRLYRRIGDHQVCLAGAETSLHPAERVPVGSSYPLKAGSVAQALLAWESPERLHAGLKGARFTAATLAEVRRRGWAQSVGERGPGVATVATPVRGPEGRTVAALSLSGPVRSLSREPGREYGGLLMDAAITIGEVWNR